MEHEIAFKRKGKGTALRLGQTLQFVKPVADLFERHRIQIRPRAAVTHEPFMFRGFHEASFIERPPSLFRSRGAANNRDECRIDTRSQREVI